MRKIYKIIVAIVVALIMSVPTTWAQKEIYRENYEYMWNTPIGDSLYWEGQDSITPNIILGIIDTLVGTPFEVYKKNISWKHGSKIVSSIEKEEDFQKVVVLFYYEKSKWQKYIYFEYQYDNDLLPEEDLDENFILYLDYCQNNLGGQVFEDNWLKLKMFPFKILCAEKLTPDDFSKISKYRNLDKLHIKQPSF